MGDVWSTVAEATEETQEMLADAMEQRSDDPVFVALRARYLEWLDPMPGGTVVEMGCGPGDATRALLDRIGAARAIGIDPSPVIIERAAARHADEGRLAFAVGDARNTDLEAESVDLVLYHTTMCHIPQPDRTLIEAARILKPGGQLVIFDGDYATTTAALGPHDPVALVIDHAMSRLVHDPYFCRTLAPRLSNAGFQLRRTEVLPYLASGNAAFFMSLFNRGCVFLKEAGLADDVSLAALRAEIDARIAEGRFYGFTAFHGVIAVKPV